MPSFSLYLCHDQVHLLDFLITLGGCKRLVIKSGVLSLKSECHLVSGACRQLGVGHPHQEPHLVCRNHARSIGTAFEKRQDLRFIICNALQALCLQNRQALKVCADHLLQWS